MAAKHTDPIREKLEHFVGKPLGSPEPQVAPDAVNLPMIRHWVDAMDDRNPVYLYEDAAKRTRFGGIVAPPAMLQAWTMGRPKIQGIAERGGSPDDIAFDNPITALDEEGFVATLATNSELEFERYLRPGDVLRSVNILESISTQKKTGLGLGYFITWVTTYTDGNGDVVGRQLFRILKFKPGSGAADA